MKKTTVIKNILAAGILAISMTACGSADSSSPAKNMAYEYAADAGGMIRSESAEVTEEMALYDEAAIAEDGMAVYEEAEAVAEEPAAEAPSSVEVSESAAAERKLIKTVNISAETEAFDTLIPELQGEVEALGGYIENISVYDMDSYYVESRLEKQRGADITARVPKEKLDGFLARVGEQTNVTSRSESVEDVTLQYVDLESHKKALLLEQERLMELLQEAESVEDTIAIEGRLSEVRYQLESMESQLRTYDNRIDYSTVYLFIQEVRNYSPSENASVGQRIADGFVKSLKDIGYGIRDFAIGFVIDIPYILLWIVIIAVAALVLRLLWKMGKKRALKREAARGENGEKEKGRVQLRWPVTIKRGHTETESNGTEDKKDDE